MLGLLITAVAVALAATFTAPPPPSPGPMVGDLTSSSVRILVHDPDGEATVTVQAADATVVSERAITTSPDTDACGTVLITGLLPGTRYTYAIDGASNPDQWFETRPRPDHACTLAFASCADEDEASGRVWDRIGDDGADALVLLGDTPYIDSTDLATQRRRYREFASFAPFARLAAHTPIYSTWDDHDFGRNDVDGRLPGKAQSRRAFIEHRPNPSFGTGDEGIFTSLRMGPVEVFILDTRWFARTTGDADDPTLLGDAQWRWLEAGLASSTAPFRIITCGMIFNGATRPGKTDHWGMYPKEYDRLLGVLERTGPDGVLLVSGDIHWSRVIEHDTKARLGRNLTEIITSPVHHRLIKAADAWHPGTVFSAGIVNSFLLVEAATDAADRTSTLVARIRDAAGTTHHETTLTSTRPSGRRLVTQGNGRIAIVDGHGDVDWERPWGGIHDIHVTDDGHIWVQRGAAEVVEVDIEVGDAIWNYDSRTRNGNDGKPVEVHAFQPLPANTELNPTNEWRLMVAESGPARIIEVNRDGELLATTPMTVDHPHPHTDTRLVRKIAADRYLVCHEGDGTVREYELGTGRVVWEYAVPMFGREHAGGHGPESFGNKCFAALRRANGNTLIATGNGHSVIEVTPAKEIVWSVTQHELPGIRLAWVTTIDELPNGNYLIGNCHAGEGQPLLVEIDPDTKAVVWTFDQYDRFGNSVPNSQVLGVPGIRR